MVAGNLGRDALLIISKLRGYPVGAGQNRALLQFRNRDGTLLTSSRSEAVAGYTAFVVSIEAVDIEAWSIEIPCFEGISSADINFLNFGLLLSYGSSE
ncbi:hypothetical protein G9A89_016774 [Geosiphon pyriformis]|nr:hypothetical protein G9A89_016774 [Geosiphon pyriformis]